MTTDELRQFFEVAAALRRIRDLRLYRETHATFEAYCAERWGLGPDLLALIDEVPA